jgi:hypothetical protein
MYDTIKDFASIEAVQGSLYGATLEDLLKALMNNEYQDLVIGLKRDSSVPKPSIFLTALSEEEMDSAFAVSACWLFDVKYKEQSLGEVKASVRPDMGQEEFLEEFIQGFFSRAREKESELDFVNKFAECFALAKDSLSGCLSGADGLGGAVAASAQGQILRS